MIPSKGLYRIASQENLDKYQALIQSSKQSQSQKRLNPSEEHRSIDKLTKNVLEKFYLYKQTDQKIKQSIQKIQQIQQKKLMNNLKKKQFSKNSSQELIKQFGSMNSLLQNINEKKQKNTKDQSKNKPKNSESQFFINAYYKKADHKQKDQIEQHKSAQETINIKQNNSKLSSDQFNQRSIKTETGLTPEASKKKQYTRQTKSIFSQKDSGHSQSSENILFNMKQLSQKLLQFKNYNGNPYKPQQKGQLYNNLYIQERKKAQINSHCYTFNNQNNQNPNSLKQQMIIDTKTKSHNDFTIILNFDQQQIVMEIDSNVMIKQLLIQILQKIQQNTRNNQQKAKQQDEGAIQSIIGFTTLNEQIQIDYYLTQFYLKATPLLGQIIKIKPLYRQPISKEVCLKDFIFIKNIGIGGFSLVYLVRKKDNGKFYAMKLIDKQFIYENNKENIVQNERDIMTSLNHPFLINLFYSFENKQFIVFVMEYCQGGELFYQLKQIKRMNEDQACFYISEICLGLKELHKLNILYRDIKPENILMDVEGHIRIADFGLSKPKIDEEDLAYSFCGSPEYMAPEMLLKSGHNKTVDYYCLGALLYELLTGLPPYYSLDTQEIYYSILNEDLTFPDQKFQVFLSGTAKDLLQKLLQKHPGERLGVNGGIDEILSHEYFKKIDFKELENKRIKPPLKPDPLKFNIDENESKKGEQELKQKLLLFSQNNAKIFKDFYYEKDEENNQIQLQQLWKSEMQRNTSSKCSQIQKQINNLIDYVSLSKSIEGGMQTKNLMKLMAHSSSTIDLFK